MALFTTIFRVNPRQSGIQTLFLPLVVWVALSRSTMSCIVTGEVSQNQVPFSIYVSFSFALPPNLYIRSYSKDKYSAGHYDCEIAGIYCCQDKSSRVTDGVHSIDVLVAVFALELISLN